MESLGTIRVEQKTSPSLMIDKLLAPLKTGQTYILKKRDIGILLMRLGKDSVDGNKIEPEMIVILNVMLEGTVLLCDVFPTDQPFGKY